jgi:hypothetical protein
MKRNRKWLQSRDQRKRTKVFSVKMIQLPNGDFHMLGGHSKILANVNQHKQAWVNVDTRDLARELNTVKITSF